MTKWDYKTVEVDDLHEDVAVTAVMMEAGQEGWELVTVVPVPGYALADSTRSAHLFFKWQQAVTRQGSSVGSMNRDL